MPDVEESGGGGCEQPPRSCPLEGAAGGRSDDVPDFLDWDSDGDGVPDAEESAFGLERCQPLSGGEDGPTDLQVAARQRACSAISWGTPCARRSGSARSDDEPLFVALWNEGEEVPLDLVEPFVPSGLSLLTLLDATVSMQGERWGRLRASLLGPGGLFDALRRRVPGLRVALATHTDLPLGSFGARDDELLTLWRPALGWDAEPSLAEAFDAISFGNGGDEPEGWHLALQLLASGEGRRWRLEGGERYEAPSLGARCLPGRLGAACRWKGIPALVLHVSDACPHEGMGCELSGYTGVLPRPETPAEVADSLAAQGLAYQGMVPWSGGCSAEPPDAAWSPCSEMRRFGAVTGGPGVMSGEPVPGLPSPSERGSWSADMAARIEAWWRRQRWDVTVEASLLPVGDADWLSVNVTPACDALGEACWESRAGAGEAGTPVLALQPDGFSGVRSGLLLRWRLRLRALRGPGDRVRAVWVRVRWWTGGLVVAERWVLASLAGRDGLPRSPSPSEPGAS